MTIRHNLDLDTAVDGEAWAGDVDSALNYLVGTKLGLLISVEQAAVNAVTAQIQYPTGFSSLVTGAQCMVRAVATNTGAMTLQLFNNASPPASITSAVGIRSKDRNTLGSGNWVNGIYYPLFYDGTYWIAYTID